MRFPVEQLVEWRGSTWKVIERMFDDKSRISNSTGEEHVILDCFLEQVGEIVACPFHHLSDKTAPLFHRMDWQQKEHVGFTSQEYTDKAWYWYRCIRAASLKCEDCQTILARAICSCGRIKDTEGNCKNFGCVFPEAEQPAIAEEDVVEITAKNFDSRG